MPGKKQQSAARLHTAIHKHNYPNRPITETLTNGLFTVDNTWTVKYWNKAAEKILKVPATDIVGKNLMESSR